MTIIGKRVPFYLLVIPVLLILTILVSLSGAVNNSPERPVKVLTETDFFDNSELFAVPDEEIVAIFLESPVSTGELNDTGAIGFDIIPYKYTEAIEQTFCWDDDDGTAEHSMTLIDSNGDEVITVYANGDCVTETIAEGEYEMNVTHDGKTDKRVAVFIVPEGDKSLLTTASDEALQNVTSVLNTDKCVGCDLSDVNLNNADLSNVDLRDAILNNAILVDADLSGADLSGASLKNADLSRANLRGANLSGADLTNAILINADLTEADLKLANLENADTEGAKFSETQLTGSFMPDDSGAEFAQSVESQSRVHTEVVATLTCTTGAIAPGTGEDLKVTGPCTVGAGTYQYRKVNIYGGGSLTFDDAVIDFWAYSIIVENEGSLIAGTETDPIGKTGGKLTIHLYGEDQGVGGSGVLCQTPMTATVGPCGIPKAIWDTDGSNKVCLPPEEGGDTATCKPFDYFYQYKPLPQDGGDPNAYFGYKVLGVSYGGTLRLFGKKGSTLPDSLTSGNSGTSWGRLNGTLNKGATQLKVDRPVDWEVGDRIVVTTTDYLPGHSEVLEIVAPAVNQTTFNFKVIDPFTGADIAGGLQYPHNGTPYNIDQDIADNIGWETTVDGNPAAETRAAVALLSRSIRIVSAGDTFNSAFPPVVGNYFGGHTQVRQGVMEFKVQGVEFYQLGQGGKMGHYPVHFHLTRKMPDGTFVKDSSIHDSMTRWITLHGAQGVTLSRNVGYLSIGHGFYLEDGTEINNKFYSNIGIFARAAVKNPQNPRQVPGILAWAGRPDTAFPPYNSDNYNPTVFWIMNGWNDFEYNMAAGATGCGVCYWLVPGSNSGHSQGMKWESYASMQSGPVMMDGGSVYEVNLARAGMTPLKTFKGNYCTTTMMSFNTVGDTDSCLGVSAFGVATNPNAPVPAVQPVPDGGKGSQEKETFYPKVTGGGGRFATRCDGMDCGPDVIKNRCGNGNRDNCMVTVLDKYTSSFHWPQQNFAAVWLRPQWYLVINNFLSDMQNGGLGFVTGGDYTLSSIVPGLWQLATKSVFVGHTQSDNPLASNAGPFNPLMSADGKVSGLICDNGDANHCRSAKEGISIPIDNFAVNQRLFNIYDGPNYQDKNAYLDIKKTTLNTPKFKDICNPPKDMSATGASKCPQFGPGVGMPAWMYTRVPGIPVDRTTDMCVLPNAAIGWKQPNGFFYPPAFHSQDLYFDNVDIRHYVLEPLWETGTYDTIEEQVRERYCTFPANNMFGNFSSVDRQTVVNDDDGSLTGLVSSAVQENISVNLDSFFNAPIEATECESFDTAKTSPYEYVSTVIYPGCATTNSSPCSGVCSNVNRPCTWDGECDLGPGNQGTCSAIWGRPCTSTDCYGVPLERQLLTSEDAKDLSTTGIRMAGMDLFQRSMMTLSGATYYVNTTVSETEQRKSAKSLNVFKGGDTYYMFFLYTKASTMQTYQFYVGTGLGFDVENAVSIVRANISTFPIKFLPGPIDWGSIGWEKHYNSTTGILTVTVDMSSFDGEYKATKKDFCQPKSFCTLDSKDQCVCTGEQKTLCESANICPTWAGKDVDCPEKGCPGFAFKLPDGFDPDDMGDGLISTKRGHRPDPVCFPNEAPWNVMLDSAGDIAGSCNGAPVDVPKFCTDMGFFTPGNPPQPPVGGPMEPDKDGDGVSDGIDRDSDNDGCPNSTELSNVVTNSRSETDVTRITIPDDPDNDGIPNELDLDSDGDGLSDHMEGGGTNDVNRDGITDNFTDVDGDGLDDQSDPDQGGILMPIPDTDGDGIPDFVDTDSDNDGITDTNETAGCIDANGDGVLDDSGDANGDGLADSVHPATGTPCIILDTDGDGLPDHLDSVNNSADGDSGEGGSNNGSCALAGNSGVKGGLAGLLVYVLIPACVLIRRKFKAKK